MACRKKHTSCFVFFLLKRIQDCVRHTKIMSIGTVISDIKFTNVFFFLPFLYHDHGNLHKFYFISPIVSLKKMSFSRIDTQLFFLIETSTLALSAQNIFTILQVGDTLNFSTNCNNFFTPRCKGYTSHDVLYRQN